MLRCNVAGASGLKHGLPLPLQVTSLSGKQQAAAGEAAASCPPFPAGDHHSNGAAPPAAAFSSRTNPFVVPGQCSAEQRECGIKIFGD